VRAAAALLGLLLAGCAGPSPLTLTERDDGRALVVPVGTRLDLNLAETVSTGYRWVAASGDPTRLVPTDTRRDTPPGPPGQGGRVIFSYQVIAPGETTLAARYERPWERESSAARRVTIRINGQE